jgi:hypothetical protein
MYPSIPISYYPTQADAISQTNILLASETNTIITVGEFTNWRIASTSTGSSLQSTVYSVGDTLVNDGVDYMYPNVPFFLEGTTILCLVNSIEKYVPIATEQISCGLCRPRTKGAIYNAQYPSSQHPLLLL